MKEKLPPSPEASIYIKTLWGLARWRLEWDEVMESSVRSGDRGLSFKLFRYALSLFLLYLY